MGKITRRGSAALAAAVAATLAFAPVAGAATGDTNRVAGADRYRTAVQASKQANPISADTVVLAWSGDYADALTAVPLVRELDADGGASLLLTGTDELTNFTRAEINRLGASDVIIVGGTGVISENVASQVAALDSVENVRRIAGDNRFETAEALALETVAEYQQSGAYITARTAYENLLAAQTAPAQARAELDRAQAALKGLQDELGAAQAALSAAFAEQNAAAQALQDAVAGNTIYAEWLELVLIQNAQTAAAQTAYDEASTAHDFLNDLQIPANFVTVRAFVEDSSTSPALDAQINGAATELFGENATPDPLDAAQSVVVAAAGVVVDGLRADLDEEQAELAYLFTDEGRIINDQTATPPADQAPLVAALDRASQRVDAARKTVNDLTSSPALTAAQNAYNEALVAWQNATANVPTAEDLAQAQSALEDAEEALLAGASDVEVFLTTGRNFADALAAGPAAASVDGVVLLTADETVVDETADFIEAASSETVYAVGGPAARGYDGETLNFAGESRYDTAAQVANHFWGSNPADIAVASGQVFPDALVAGATIDGPLLLTWQGALPQETAEYLEDKQTEVFIFGGLNVISASVDAEINRLILGN